MHAFLGAGWEVLATYRPERGDPWSGIPRVTGLPLDLLDGDSIASLAARVTELDVLYCNAGYVLAGPVETCTLEQTREQFEANAFGHLDLMQRLLPVLRRSPLRDSDRAGILWTCSISAEAAMKALIPTDAKPIDIKLAPQAVAGDIEPGDPAYPGHEKHVAYKIAG